MWQIDYQKKFGSSSKENEIMCSRFDEIAIIQEQLILNNLPNFKQ